MLESKLHDDNAFVTLTYADDAQTTLEPKHLQDWLKRFRKTIEPQKIRYYAVGEYGDNSQRPHYHLALFGFRSCFYGWTRPRTHLLNRSCCPSCDLIRDTWGHGAIFLGTLEDHSANYIAGYVTKKLTSKNDDRLNGRHPEFGRMSNRPGIGYHALHEIAHTLLTFNLDETQPDVPSELRHGSRKMPLGPYLTKKLRLMVGHDEKTPQAIKDQQQEKLRPLQEAARASKDNPSLASQIRLASAPKALSLEARLKIFKQRKTI